MRFFLLLLLSIFLTVGIYAQPGCPQIDAGQDITLSCAQNCATLTANPIFSGQSNTYRVDQISYNPFPYNGGTNIFIGVDDEWSNIINLPFTFCFFDNSYDQIVVGANGLISFDVSNAGNYCDWDLTAVGQLPTTATYTNSIMGAYQDLDPSLGGSINYQILGAYPCRIFVVSFDVPMYDSNNFTSDCNGLDAKQQIVIYETTNIIEVYIEEKEACPGSGGIFGGGWNDGLAILGIQDATGTQAFPVPGRNNTVWTASNEGWRWTPDGPPSYTVNWYENGSLIGNGETVSVCPTSTSSYTAEATYTPCTGGTPVVVSNGLTVTVTGMTMSIDTSANVSCFGANDGYAEATVNGGVPPVTYEWQPSGSTSLVQNNLSPGTYYFTAEDDAGCIRTDSVVINEPPQIVVDVPDTTISNCSGTATGYLSSSAQGGTPPYTYEWNTNPAQNTQTATGISPGTYTVTVTDSLGCTSTASGTMTVTVVNNLTLNLVDRQDLSCYQSDDGSIEVALQNGTPPLTYEWNTNPVQNTASVSGLASGTYTVTASDDNGCSLIDSFTVNEPDQLLVNIDTFGNITCVGADDGFVQVSADGGTPSYNFAWSTVPTQNTPTISDLSAGTYTVTITDDNACFAIDSIEIIEPDSLFADITASQDASCFGYDDGSATVTVSGGAPGYTYEWDTNPVQNTATANGIPAGFYEVRVTDAGNCTVTDTVTIDQPEQILVTVDTIIQPTCFGTADGAAEVSVSGGNLPHTYEWSTTPVQNTSTLSGVSAGTYEVTVSDAAQCITVTGVVIEDPEPVVIEPQIDSITCDGSADGAITLASTGGTPNYTYTWEDPAYSGNSVSQLNVGTYSVSVADANGCVDSIEIILEEPFPLSAVLNSTDITCFGYADGTIDIEVSGGTGAYNYQWTNEISQLSYADNLAPDSFSITISDQNGCDTILNTELNQPDPIVINLPDTFEVDYGNSIALDNNISGGIGDLVYDWTPSTWLDCFDCQIPESTPDYTIIHEFTVVDENTCTASASTTVLVNIDKTIYIPNAFSPNGDDINDELQVFVGDVSFFSFKIFTYWGELIFATNDINENWDGTYKGKPVNPDVYVYHLEVGYPDLIEDFRKGSLTVIR